MNFFDRMTKGEFVLVVGAVFCGLICAFLLFDDRWLSQNVFSSSPEIGSIRYVKNDTRIRFSDSLTFLKARSDQGVHLGDTLFAGDASTAEVELNKGGSITIGENSSVVFRDIDGEKIANFEAGNFRIKVNGKVQIAVRGKLTTFEGTNSVVQILMTDNKRAQVRLLTGHAKLQEKDKESVELETQTVAMTSEFLENAAPTATVAQASIKLSSPLPAARSKTTVIHIFTPRVPRPRLEQAKQAEPQPAEPDVIAKDNKVEKTVPTARSPAAAFEPENPGKIPRFNFWGGVGVDYLNFGQTSSQDLDAGSFAKASIPAYMAGANLRVSNRMSVQVEGHDWPGKVTTKDSTQIDTTSYHWRSLIGEAQYRFVQNTSAYYSALFGVQVHDVPFLNVNGDGTANLFENQLQNVFVGAKVNYLTRSKFEYEGLVRYQSVLASKSLDGNGFKAKPGLMFDGSLGVSRKFLSDAWVGFYWFGQYQNIKYDFDHEGTASSGGQTFFNSNFQFRLGYSFGGGS